jgi:alginate O-acetyltransferase complex protein AlgJ
MANKGEKNPAPDPCPAILRFHEDCRKAGVCLVLVPVPDKAQVQPGSLTRRLEVSAPMEVPANAGWETFLARLREQGVEIFDPLECLPGRNAAGRPVLLPGEVHYLRQDTHWTPEFMERVAERLAEHLKGLKTHEGRPRLPPPAIPFAATLVPRAVARLGDIVDMLKLTGDQRIFQPQTVNLRQVRDAATGELWRSDSGADVLLLGDSFTNVFSDGEGKQGLGWGESAGFGPHLSRCLGRPLEVLARNGSGATRTREELARRPDPLGGKRIIVWEFAVRDLACENWLVVPIASRAGPPPPIPPSQELTVSAELITPVPAEARQVGLYADAIVDLKFKVLAVESGRYEPREILVSVTTARNFKLQFAARMQAGSAYRLKLKPEAPAASKTWTHLIGALDRDLHLYWAEAVEAAP